MADADETPLPGAIDEGSIVVPALKSTQSSTCNIETGGDTLKPADQAGAKLSAVVPSDTFIARRGSDQDFFTGDIPSNEIEFVTPSCTSMSPWSLCIIRVALLLSWLVVWTCTNIEWVQAQNCGYEYFWSKLTHWTMTLQMVYFFVSAVTTILILRGHSGQAVATLIAVVDALHAIVPTSAFLVFVMYWATVYTPGQRLFWTTVGVHGGNVVWMIPDMLLGRRRHRLRHIYWLLLYGALYATFTVLYFFAGGKYEDGVSPYIYSTVDWRKPMTAAIFVGALFFCALPAGYLMCSGVVAARVRWCQHPLED